MEYHKEGNLRLGKTTHHMEILQGLTDRATVCGLDVRMIDGKEVREINPFLSDEVIEPAGVLPMDMPIHF